MNLIRTYRFVSDLLAASGERLQSVVLLVLRLWWGWSFFLTGRGKLLHLDRTAEFFATLHIPAPKLNALAAGTTECVGGLLLLVGLGSRLAAVPLIFTLLVAYATAEREALAAVFSDPDRFTSAAPFLFLLVAVLVFAFGPGRFSLDHLWAGRRAARRERDPVALGEPAAVRR